ncbi:MAG: acyl-[acyl-carrier-protein] thioesterase [Rhodothermales bacterium]
MEAYDPLSTVAQDKTIWTEVFTVRSFEAGVSGTLSIQNLCNYFQEAAGNHARALGVSVEQLQQKRMTWMLSRLHVKVQRYPSWKDTVFVDTWPSGHNGLFATREFRMYTEAGDQVARGTSAWLLIDLRRRRPMRMPDFIDQIPVPEIPRAIPDPFLKILSPEQATIQRHFEVRFSDLDVNGHANNVSFINWAVESVPATIQKTHQLKAIEVNFRTEAHQGHTIISKARKDAVDGGMVLHHALFNASDEEEKEIATVRSRWSTLLK